jgi:hypothetical protein
MRDTFLLKLLAVEAAILITVGALAEHIPLAGSAGNDCQEACPRPDWPAASERIALLDRDRGGYGDALCCPRAARARS